MPRKLAVVAIGGNALIQDPARMSVHDQAELMKEICASVAAIVRSGWRVVVTHGNGPQVGMVMRRSELAAVEVPALSLDYAGADLQGGIGYMFARGLRNEFDRLGMLTDAAALITQVVVDAGDPAFAHPTKPVGSWMEEREARRLAGELGWTVAEDSGRGWRRLVPSPEPRSIVELPSIRRLVEAETVVVACGGGGVPVVRRGGELEGVEAVIDKDFSSVVLARGLGADALVLATGVDRVAFDFNTPRQRFVDRLTVGEARRACEEGQFAAGSMLPKIRALIDFVEGGGTGVVAGVSNLAHSLNGRTGTRIVPDAA
ncbi:carbamate kinase [Pseudodesulfovibrio indicus]|uniref:carbamate kinase n=1 Tax=Pseudodesulfovibrio indicus TaxID=1716143 RepID=UPI00292D9B81|nr:carbamate kinase [Pseudodesulfovibrio indicus]